MREDEDFFGFGDTTDFSEFGFSRDSGGILNEYLVPKEKINLKIDSSKYELPKPFVDDLSPPLEFIDPCDKIDHHYDPLEGLRESIDDLRGYIEDAQRFIVTDYTGGVPRRLEFKPGIGPVDICVGHKIKFVSDANGVIERLEVPIYKTRFF